MTIIWGSNCLIELLPNQIRVWNMLHEIKVQEGAMSAYQAPPSTSLGRTFLVTYTPHFRQVLHYITRQIEGVFSYNTSHF
jgi:hypothetical protein